jgi:hypothetical protein
MDKRTQHKLKTQVLIFIGLFILVEIILRLFGMKARTLIDDFKIQENPVYEPRFVADEMGINHFYQNALHLMPGTVLNKEGFRGKFDHTKSTLDSIRKYTSRKIVMIVGDSYVEGCCADSVKNSFTDLVAKGTHYEVLNFGVGATDPLQYQLIVRKYAKELKPDIIVVAFYFGNDIWNCERTPTPYVPISFPFKDNIWIYEVAPSHLSQKLNYCFKTADEAYQFYIDKYTLAGKDRNWIEKTFSYSVICSKLYLHIEQYQSKKLWDSKRIMCSSDDFEVSHKHLSVIKKVADSLHIRTVLVGIPSPEEAANNENLREKYKTLFRELEWHVPTNLTSKDYDGMTTANHFNNFGHKKYAVFLDSVIMNYIK